MFNDFSVTRPQIIFSTKRGSLRKLTNTLSHLKPLRRFSWYCIKTNNFLHDFRFQAFWNDFNLSNSITGRSRNTSNGINLFIWTYILLLYSHTTPKPMINSKNPKFPLEYVEFCLLQAGQPTVNPGFEHAVFARLLPELTFSTQNVKSVRFTISKW